MEETQSKYDSINTRLETLILNDEEQNAINTQLETIKKSIDENNITGDTNNIFENINKKIDEIKNNNVSTLSNKENECNNIDISKFNEEQKIRLRNYKINLMN